MIIVTIGTFKVTNMGDDSAFDGHGHAGVVIIRRTGIRKRKIGNGSGIDCGIILVGLV